LTPNLASELKDVCMARGCQYPIGTFEEVIFDIVSKIIASSKNFKKEINIFYVYGIFLMK
jgi:hypothetical protein